MFESQLANFVFFFVMLIVCSFALKNAIEKAQNQRKTQRANGYMALLTFACALSIFGALSALFKAFVS